MFKEIDDIIAEFKDTASMNPDDTDCNMRKLGSYFATINTALARIDAEHSIVEDEEYLKSLDAINNSGTKVNATLLGKQVEKTATSAISDYIRASKVYQSYLDSCDRLISICQSSLKSWDKERGNSR